MSQTSTSIFHMLLFMMVSGARTSQSGDTAVEIGSQGQLAHSLMQIARTRAHTMPVGIPHDIPRIIHQSWKTSDLPEAFRVWSQTWKDCLPDWEYKLHTDWGNRRIFKKDFPELLETFDGYPQSIQRADASRLAYMAKDGGFYVDLDIECLKDPGMVLDQPDSIVLACEGCHQISNAFIMGGKSAKGFFKELLQKLPEESGKRSPISATGPGFWTQYASEMLNGSWHTTNGAKNHLTYSRPGMTIGATILDDSQVFGAAWNNEKMKTAALNRSWVLENFPDSVGFSHWTGSWLGKELPTPAMAIRQTNEQAQMSHEEQCQCLLSTLTDGVESNVECQTHVGDRLLAMEPCTGRACFQNLMFEYRDSCI